MDTVADFISNDFGDYYLHEVNGAVFNQIGATAFYQSHFQQSLFEDETFYVIIGTDSGNLPQYIQQKCNENGSQYIFIELDCLLDKITSIESMKQCHIYSLTTWREAADELLVSHYFALAKVKCIYSIGALDAHMPEYRTLTQQVEQELQQAQWTANVNKVGKVFIQQQLRNIAENQIPANCLRDIAENKTAMILAGGPSLDDVLAQIDSVRDKVVLVAVSRICARLSELNIIPDIVISIDPTDKMFAVSKEMLSMGEVPLFVNGNHASPLLLSAWQGKSVYMGNRVPWESKLNHDNIKVIPPTVTNSAIHLCVQMGFSQILLAGVDLCYSKQGYSHAKGSQEYKAGPKIGFLGQQVELNDGSNGETEHGFYAAIKVISEQAKAARERGCDIINLSAKAAKMDNVQFKALDDISIEPLTVRIAELINEQLAQHEDSDNLKVCLNDIRHIYAECNEIIDLASNAQKLNEILNKKPNIGANLIKKIEKIEGIIEEKHSNLLSVIKLYHYSEFINVYRPKKRETWQQDEINAGSAVYLKAYQTGAQAFQELLKDIRTRTMNRIQEQSQQPTIHKLLEQWVNDKHYCRAHHYIKSHAQLFEQLSIKQQKLLDICEQGYKEQINITLPAEPVNDYQLFKNTQTKMYRQYQQFDIDNLQWQIQALSNSQHEWADDLIALANGYLSELNNNHAQAVDYYHKAAQGYLPEMALSHLVSALIEQKDFHNAILALECLTHINFDYLPQYGELVATSDQVAARQAYEKYLTLRPNDSVVRNHFDKLCQQPEKPDVCE